MTEAIWIELIKVLPAFLWIGFGFIALAVAKRVLSAQAPRMTRVETPWVTVELAQQAIEQASMRGNATDVPPFQPNWNPPLPAQQNGTGFAQPGPPGNGSAPPPPSNFNRFGSYGGAPSGTAPTPGANGYGGPPPFGAGPISGSPRFDARPTGGPPPFDAVEDREADPYETDQDTDLDAEEPNTPPADEPSDNNGGKESAEAPPSPVTEPNRQVPNVPPTYPIRVAPPGGAGGYAAPPGGPSGYYAPPIPARPTSYAASAPLPPYQGAPAYQPADAQRGLRAATKLALSADLLQGGAILWVDDHHEWNEPLIRLFRTAGMTVDAVASTPRAVLALKDRSYDLVITDMRRSNEADGASAGIVLLDKMVEVGIPTPAVIFSGNPIAQSNTHPRAVASTSSPETLVDTVVDIVSARRVQSQGSSWLDRLRS
jgi:CheY-like chemotaxis protein